MKYQKGGGIVTEREKLEKSIENYQKSGGKIAGDWEVFYLTHIANMLATIIDHIQHNESDLKGNEEKGHK
ncbi:MAG: hypothetical protein IKK40_02100 [Bacteroidales bacterium]|nr:hypothetical protein [Bacteroidales bacterium]